MNNQLVLINPTLRELTLEEIDSVNGGNPITQVAVAVGALWAGAFSAGYNAGVAAGQALWG